jgi:PEP-CTERM motif
LKIEIGILFALAALCGNGAAQGFVNLNFEQSVINSGTSGTANVSGWTEYNGWSDVNYSGGMTVVYNNQTLDDSGIALEGTDYWTPAIQGKYSILLFGGSIYAENSTNGAAIGQTGQIPASAQSITYWGSALQVTFDGQPLSFTTISNEPNYTVWGADISAYAGQTGQLLFTAPWPNGGGLLDNIQFSSSPVPEPSALALFTLGGVLLAWRQWKTRAI